MPERVPPGEMADILVRNWDTLKDLSTEQQLDRIREIASLENEMQELGEWLSDHADEPVQKFSAEHQLWSELQLRLRAVDPNSPLANRRLGMVIAENLESRSK